MPSPSLSEPSGRVYVGHQGQAVACRQGDGVHLGERLVFEILAVGEEEAGGARRPIVQIEARRAVVDQVEHDPEAIVERAADDLRLAIRDRAQVGQVGLDGRVEDLPAFAGVDERDRLHVFLGGMPHDIADIDLGILGQQGGRAGRQIAGQQRGRVAAAAVAHEEHLSRLVETGRAGRQAVLGGDRFPQCPIVAGRLVHLQPAVGGHPHRAAQTECIIGQEGHEAVVLPDEGQLARADVQPVDVVKLHVALVDGDQDLRPGSWG